MFLSGPISNRIRRATKLSLLLLICIPGAACIAQNPTPQSSMPGANLTPLPQSPAPQHNAHVYSDQDYSRGKRQWPNPFVIYATRQVGLLNVTNSPRIDQLIKDG